MSKAMAKVTIVLGDKTSKELLVELEDLTLKSAQQITSIIKEVGYSDFKVKNFKLFNCDAVIFGGGEFVV